MRALGFILIAALAAVSPVAATDYRFSWAHPRPQGNSLGGAAFESDLVGYAVGGAFVNIGYWDLMYYEIVLVVVACRLASGHALPVTDLAVDSGVRSVRPPPAGSAQQRAG